MTTSSRGHVLTRRVASVAVGVLIMLSAELWMSSLLTLAEIYWSTASTQVVVLSVTIIVFALAGLSSGLLSQEHDIAPLVAIEVVGLGFVLLSLGMAAVETGMAGVKQNAIIGFLALVATAVAYFASKRQTYARRATRGVTGSDDGNG